jgi:hypothetical protein
VGFVGSAGHGSVRVELSEAGAAAGVAAAPRVARRRAERLGPTVLQGLRRSGVGPAAGAGRRSAACLPTSRRPRPARARQRSRHGAPVLLAEAAQDLREFVRQLAALHDNARAPWRPPGGRVTATVRSGQIVALDRRSRVGANRADGRHARALGPRGGAERRAAPARRHPAARDGGPAPRSPRCCASPAPGTQPTRSRPELRGEPTTRPAAVGRADHGEPRGAARRRSPD